MRKKWVGFCLTVMFIATSAFAGDFRYNVKAKHGGGNVTPAQAYEMVQKDPDHTFIVDTRTRPEYQMIGHPVGAYNIPLKFWSNHLGEKKYTMTPNQNFEKDLLARFNPATDKLIFMCRSGKRSCMVCQSAINAGWAEKDICSMLGGFEGDKINNENSIFNGRRMLGGWRNEGLPCTYHIDKTLVYKADLGQ